MIRRTYASPQPTLTRGEDRPQPACAGKPEPFDVLTDLTAGPAFRAAQREARALCAACPIAATCLRDNRGEAWARAVLGRKPRVDVACGTESGYKRHRRLGEASCDECKEAQAAAERRRYARRKKAAA